MKSSGSTNGWDSSSLKNNNWAFDKFPLLPFRGLKVKHGTCAKSSIALRGQYNYFKGALDLYDSFHVGKWLSESDILPSLEFPYTLEQIHHALEMRLGHLVKLECAPPRDSESLPLLSQIYICVRKHSLEPIDCPVGDDKQCGMSSVIYPDLFWSKVLKFL